MSNSSAVISANPLSLPPRQISYQNAPREFVKRRATRACLECRARKIRCDAGLSHGKCNNCRLDGKVCHVDGRGRRGHELRMAQALDTRPIEPSKQGYAEADELGVHPILTLQDIGPGQNTSAHSQNVLQQTIHVPFPNDSPGSRMTGGASTAESVEERIDPIALPRFIKPLPMDLDMEDLRHLSAKGVFSILPPKLQNIALSRYVDFIHPLLPLLNLNELLAILAGQSKKKIPLVLYHSVMCAGLAAVETKHILEHGYASKPMLRHQCYVKAKLLFDLDVDMNSTLSCQVALLLMTWSGNNTSTDATYWTGVAINQVRVLQIHKDDTRTFANSSEIRLRRRLWWLVFSKDVDVSLSLSARPRTSPEGMRLLDTTDFESTAFVVDHQDFTILKLNRMNPKVKDSLEALCVQKIRLSLALYPLLMGLNVPRDASTVSLSPQIWLHDAALEKWYTDFPSSFSGSGLSIEPIQERDIRIDLSLSVVIMTYWLGKSMLHKNEVALCGWLHYSGSGSLEDANSALRLSHVMAMRRSANRIFETHVTLRDNDMIQHLPAMAIASMCAVVFVNLLDARSELTALRQTSLQRLELSVAVLKELGELSFAATDIAALVELSVKTAKIQMKQVGDGLFHGRAQGEEDLDDFGLDVVRRGVTASRQGRDRLDNDSQMTEEGVGEDGPQESWDIFQDTNCLEFLRMEEMIDLDIGRWLEH